MLSGRTNFTWEQRIEAVEMYLSGNYSYTEVAGKFGTIISTLKNWINSYKNNGIDGLKESRTWRKYPLELKHAAVSDYLSGKFSLLECWVLLQSFKINNEHSVLTAF